MQPSSITKFVATVASLQVAKNGRNMTEKDLVNAYLVHTVQSHASNE